MRSRLDMQEYLQQLLGSKNVYFQPPEGMRISYPAFIYNPSKRGDRFANNSRYLKRRSYFVQYVSPTYDERFVESILDQDYCSFDRYFAKDDLHHFNFTMFY